MFEAKKDDPKHRPLASPLALSAVVVAFAGAMVYAWPMVVRRGKAALETEATSLSLSYARMALRDDPDDAQLRLKLAQRLLPLGAWTEVEDTLSPLLALTTRAGKEARLVHLQLSYHRLLSAGEGAPQRVENLEAFHADVLRAAKDSASVDELVALADLAASGDCAELRAQLEQQAVELRFNEIQSGQGTPAALVQQIERADRGWLAVEQPDAAAALWLRATDFLAARDAERAEGLLLTALQRVRQGGDTARAFRLSESWAERLPESERLHAVHRELAAELGPETALQVALGDLEALPGEPSAVRAAARWALWAGKRALALDILAHACGTYACEPREWNSFRHLAAARGDARMLLQVGLSQARLYGLTPERLQELIELHEALGEPERALSLLRSAPIWAAGAPRSRYLAANLARRAGHVEQEVQFLEGVRALGGRLDGAARMRLADGYAALGRSRDSLRVMAEDMASQQPEALRRLRVMALQNDELELAESAGATLLHSELAVAEDVALQAELLAEMAQTRRSVGTLLAGFERFGDKSLLHRALRVYELTEPTATALSAFDELSAKYASLLKGPELSRMRIGLHHRLANEAQRAGDGHGALNHLLLANKEFHYLGSRSDWAVEDRALWQANRRTTLSVGLEIDHAAAIADSYADVSDVLSRGERVFVLRRMGRDEVALDLALSGLRAELWASSQEREQLAQAVLQLEPARRRSLYAGARWNTLSNMEERGVHVRGVFSLSEFALLVGADAKELRSADRQLLPSSVMQQVRPAVGLGLSRDLVQAEGYLGVDLRSESSVRPTLSLSLQSRGGALEFGSMVAVNAVPTTTAALRIGAMRHTAQISAMADMGLPFVQGSLAGHSYHRRRDDAWLGGSATARLDVGVRDRFPALGTSWNARLIGQALPTVLPERAYPLMSLPESTVFVGVGSGLVRGDVAQPRLWGREVSLEVDAAFGWLMPQRALGFFGSAGIGVPVLGADMMAFRCAVDNVTAGAVGQTNIGLQINYAFSFMR